MARHQRFERLRTLTRGGEIGVLGFVDQRADPIGLGALRQRPADRGHDLVEAFERHRAGVDRLPSGRLFGQPRHVEIAIGGHHQGARDRRRGHQQGVGVMALFGEGQALLDAKAVLLVDDHEREVAKGDVGLQQRVGPDDDRGQARGEAGQGRVARPAFLPPGQQPDLDPGGPGEPPQGRLMLAGEDLGRRHQRGLRAALDRRQHRHQRDHGLAAADIALQQPHHPPGLRHLGADLGDRHALRPGQRKAERRPRPWRRACPSRRSPGRGAAGGGRGPAPPRAGSRTPRHRQDVRAPGRWATDRPRQRGNGRGVGHRSSRASRAFPGATGRSIREARGRARALPPRRAAPDAARGRRSADRPARSASGDRARRGAAPGRGAASAPCRCRTRPCR